MKMISWNVNGLRACLDKGFMDFFNSENADIFCIQETKMQEGQAVLSLPGYYQYWNSAVKKGYSGTAVFTKTEPLSVTRGIDGKEDEEGRVLTLEFPGLYLLCVYSPNSQEELKRLSYRCDFEDDLRKYVSRLKQSKSVVICGDLNVAHNDIDLKNPKTNRKNPGFSDEERGKFTELLNAGFCDSFRFLYPDLEGAYSWWSYRFKAREKNAGWRIDYFVVSNDLKDSIKSAQIRSDIFGSDHCPVMLELNI